MAALQAVPWVQIALVDLQNARAGPLVTAFQSTALAAGQADPTPNVIQKYSAEILGDISFSGRVVMDASQGTISPDVVPPNCVDLIVQKICRVLKGRLAMQLNADEIQDERTYQSIRGQIRRGEYPIDATNNPGNLAGIASKGGAVASIPGLRPMFGPQGGSFFNTGL